MVSDLSFTDFGGTTRTLKPWVVHSRIHCGSEWVVGDAASGDWAETLQLESDHCFGASLVAVETEGIPLDFNGFCSSANMMKRQLHSLVE